MPERYEELARAALLEITSAASVGDYVGTTDEGDGVVSLLFASAQPGYPDWRWTVSVAEVPGEEPTVLEAELMPAEGALLAPDWVPWSDRLAEYKAAQDNAEQPADGADDDSDLDDEPDADDDSDDEDDDDDLGNDVLHGGDLDGVDIDDLDEDDLDEDELDEDDRDDDLDDDDGDLGDEAERSY